MSEETPTTEKKTCVACFNSVDRRATKCPHCQSYQGLYRFLAFSAAISASVLLAVLIVGALLIEFGLARRVFEDDHNYADQVAIQSSEMLLSSREAHQSGDRKIVFVVGRLTNESSKVLRFIRLQVEVQNAESELVDSFQGTVTGPISPGTSAAFRIDSHNPIHLPESDYRTQIVTVREAAAEN